jgi:hypothetical protein
MDGKMAVVVKRVLGAVAIISGVTLALAGGLAAWAMWGVMATYADNAPNTLLQNTSPLLLALPAVGIGAALVWIGLGLWRRPDIE